MLTQKIIEKEFALSGSEQNPDLTGKDLKLLADRLGSGAPGPVEAFKQHGVDFVVADTLPELFDGMRALSPDVPIDTENIEREIVARDRELDNEFSKDLQLTAVRGARKYRGDKLIRVATPHRILDPKAGPAHRREAARAHPQEPRRHPDRPRLARARAPTARSSRACTRSARPPGSAAAACTATARSRAPSSADASSPAARRGASIARALTGAPSALTARFDAATP